MNEYRKFIAHFPKTISDELVRFVTDTVLLHSRYLFYKTVAGVQIAYCTHCKRTHRPVNKLKHKQEEWVKCPHCHSLCEVRAAGISRKYMVDRGVFVWYEKSVVNPQAITARVISVARDYSRDYKQVETQYHCDHMYLFEPGKSQYWQYGRKRCRTVFSAFDQHYPGSWPKFVDHGNIRNAVKGTPFEYSQWQHYTKYPNQFYVSDMVEFFDLAARYPCIEYLTKLGFSGLVWAKLLRYRTHGAINWHGKTPEKVLRISKHDIKAIRDSGLEVGPRELRYLQKQRKAGNKISVADAFALAQIDSDYYTDYIPIQHCSEFEAHQYLLKQFKRGHWQDIVSTLYDWRDYLRQCAELGMDISERRYLFPNDLQEAHEKATERVKLKRDRKLDMMIRKRQPELLQYQFESDGFIARPIGSLKELFREGKALNHCVGGYAEKYAKGGCIILVVRKTDEPDKPFYTAEISGRKIVQCRGFKNCGMTPEVEAFVRRFEAEKLKKSRKTNRKSNPERVAI